MIIGFYGPFVDIELSPLLRTDHRAAHSAPTHGSYRALPLVLDAPVTGVIPYYGARHAGKLLY